jgi:hypothetical protein
MYNLSIFFNAIRGALYPRGLPQQAVDGFEFLITENQKYKLTTPQLAYVLATAYHETAHTMQPVREGLAKTNAGAMRAVTKLYERGGIRKNYALPHPVTKQSYYGRGYVQITHFYNYEWASKVTGVDCVSDPDKVLEKQHAATILFRGMIEGAFSKGQRLALYINDAVTNYVGARRIVNGTDKKDLIASHAQEIEEALLLAKKSTAKSGSLPISGKKPLQSTTNIAAGAAVALPTIQAVNDSVKTAQDALQAGRGVLDVMQAISSQPTLWVFIVAAVAAWWIIKERKKKSYELGV